ncbi:MAG: RIP metalloprotease RseP [Novosphingobium sp.]
MAHYPSLLTTILAFLLVLGPLVLIHELGHYLVGRLFGVKVDAFSIGFGKELAGFTDRSGTRWKLSALPLGGYVQFAGDGNAASMPARQPDARSSAERAGDFHAKPLWQRSLVVLAGPLTNLLLAVAIFAAFNMIYGKAVASTEISRFSENSSAQAAGLMVGDRIIAVDGSEVDEFTEIARLVAPYPGKTLTFTVQRGGVQKTLAVPVAETVQTDRFGNEARMGRIGIYAGKVELTRLGPGESVSLAFSQTWGVIDMMVTGLRQIFVGERSVEELGGPIKIAKLSGEQLTLGWAEFTYFVALISINLAFINLLPIPALDGGHLAFYAAEAVRRKPLGQRSQEWAFRTGMVLVLALMVFVTVNDLVSLPLFGS